MEPEEIRELLTEWNNLRLELIETEASIAQLKDVVGAIKE